MFNTQILDVGIGLALMYLFQCILVSGLNEVAVAVLATRGKGLKFFLNAALKTESGEDTIFDKLSDSPVIKSVTYSKRFPSHITATNFVEAITETLSRENLDKISDVSFLKDKIKELPESEIKDLLLFKINTCKEDIDCFKLSVEQWYNDYMDRATRWYKRKIQYFIFTFSAIITLALNVDSFQVMNELWKNDKLRESSVEIGRSVAKEQYQTFIDSNMVKDKNANFDSVEVAVNKVANSYKEIHALDFPITWAYEYQVKYPGKSLDDLPFSGKLKFTAGQLLSLEKILGLLITCVAVFFGAPLWFDIIRNMLAAKDLIKK